MCIKFHLRHGELITQFLTEGLSNLNLKIQISEDGSTASLVTPEMVNERPENSEHAAPPLEPPEATELLQKYVLFVSFFLFL